MIKVSKVWLQQLAMLAQQCEKQQEKWNETDKPLMPMEVSALIGYASSAEYLAKRK